MSIFKNKKILITGGAGFLGSWLVEALQDKKPAKVIIPRSKKIDLRSKNDTEQLFRREKPDLVIHGAVRSGGIDFHLSFPADIFRDNLSMAVNILDASARFGVEKLMLIGSSCAYPGDKTGHFREKEILSGPLHPSIAPFGLSKRALLLGSQAYRQQYNLNAIYLVLTTLYGPRDIFRTTHSHVAAALIERFVDAKRLGQKEVVCWGTGRAKRECLYVKDAAEAVLLAMEKYHSPEPINIGTGRATSIKQLAELIKSVSGFKGKIVWDKTKPDGALNKVFDVSRMKKELKWEPRTSLREGLADTIEWFRMNH